MTSAIQSILKTYESLPELEQRELAYAILQRSLKFDFPSVSDEELVASAEELFLELDRRESPNGKPKPRRRVAR